MAFVKSAIFPSTLAFSKASIYSFLRPTGITVQLYPPPLGGEHVIQNKTSHPTIPVHIRMNEHEKEMSQHRPYGRMTFIFQQIEQNRHGISDRLGIEWNMLGASYATNRYPTALSNEFCLSCLSRSEWHNGLYLGVLSKPQEAAIFSANVAIIRFYRLIHRFCGKYSYLMQI